MFDFAKSIEAVGNSIKSIFDFTSKTKERQSETEIIKEKRNLKKATNIAEEAFKLMFRNFDSLPQKEQDKLKGLYDDFLEHN